MKALEFNPEDTTLQANLSSVYCNMGQYNKALPLISNILKKLPEDPLGYYYLAKYYNAQKNSEETIVNLEKCFQLDIDGYYSHLATNSDDFRSLKDLPKFQALF